MMATISSHNNSSGVTLQRLSTMPCGGVSESHNHCGSCCMHPHSMMHLVLPCLPFLLSLLQMGRGGHHRLPPRLRQLVCHML